MPIHTEINIVETENEAHFGQRMNTIIESQGLSKAWVAEKLGISKQALNYLLKHSMKPRMIDEFAELLRLDPNWVETGIGNPVQMVPSVQAPQAHDTIPVYSKEALLNDAHTNPIKTIEFSRNNAKNCFAYRLEDDSNFPPFIQETVLIFDKIKKPVNGDYVLFINDNKVFVRQYLVDGKNICLKASNLDHKTFINPNVAFLGVLLEARFFVH